MEIFNYLCYTITPIQIVGYYSSTQPVTVTIKCITNIREVKKTWQKKWNQLKNMKSTKAAKLTHWVSFANSIASSSVENVLTQRIGPKTSSLQICMDVVTSVMMAGSIKNPFFKCWFIVTYVSYRFKLENEEVCPKIIDAYLGTFPTR